MRLAVLSALLVSACAPGIHPTAHPGIYGSELRSADMQCSAKHEAEAARVAAATVAEAQRRGLLTQTPNVAVCAVDKLPPLMCVGKPVYACSIPFRNALLAIVAVPRRAGVPASQWHADLAHEVLAILGETGFMRGWPRTEAEIVKRADYKAIVEQVGR